jgi:hypothetical protein
LTGFVQGTPHLNDDFFESLPKLRLPGGRQMTHMERVLAVSLLWQLRERQDVLLERKVSTGANEEFPIGFTFERLNNLNKLLER